MSYKPPICLMLVGLPAAGKSTYVSKFLAANPGWVLVSTDFWLDKMCEGAGLTYSEGFSQFQKEAEKKMWETALTAVAQNQNILWDQTNLTVTARWKKLRKLPKFYVKKAAYFVLPDQTEWEKRLASRPGKDIPKKVLKSMLKMLEIPTKEEGFQSVEIIDTSRPNP